MYHRWYGLATETFDYYPKAKLHGLPNNLHNISDAYNSLWFELADQNYSAMYFSLFGSEYTADTVFFVSGHNHLNNYTGAMSWLQCASFSARNKEDLTTSEELILVGSFIVPSIFEVFQPCFRVTDNGNIIYIRLELYDSSDLNTVEVTQEYSIYNKSNAIYESDPIDINTLSLTGSFRRVNFRVYAKTLASTGTFYEFIAKLPRLEGL